MYNVATAALVILLEIWGSFQKTQVNLYWLRYDCPEILSQTNIVNCMTPCTQNHNSITNHNCDDLYCEF